MRFQTRTDLDLNAPPHPCVCDAQEITAEAWRALAPRDSADSAAEDDGSRLLVCLTAISWREVWK